MINSINEIDTVVKIIVASLTGIGTLLGIPLIFLTYKKTNAEIKKLNLEAQSINNENIKNNSDNIYSNDIKINIEDSPNANVKILADPRLLAPLLLLIDFIFAWILLTISKHFLLFLNIGSISQIILIGIALILLVPILIQSIKIKILLKPNMSYEDKLSSVKNVKIFIYFIWSILILLSIGFFILVMTLSPNNITKFGYIITWVIAIFGVILLIAIPITKKSLDKKIREIYKV